MDIDLQLGAYRHLSKKNVHKTMLKNKEREDDRVSNNIQLRCVENKWSLYSYGLSMIGTWYISTLHNIHE